MDTWITSDTHFFHHNVIKFCPDSRPFETVEQMNETLINNWNACVKPNDVIYHLGDFAFANVTKVENILKRLNGRKRLVLGNHDHVMTKPGLSNYFEWIKPYYSFNHESHHIVLLHYPMLSWNKSHHGSLHFHGHLHSNRVWGRSKDIGVDSNNCMPYNLKQLVEIVSQNVIESLHV